MGGEVKKRRKSMRKLIWMLAALLLLLLALLFLPAWAILELKYDKLTVRVVKVLSSYCYGIIEAVEEPGPGRVLPACPVCRRCGGCSLQHLSYQEELRAKEGWVADAVSRIGGFDLPVRPILGSPRETGYRNKAQYPIGKGEAGAFCGFYAPRSHVIIPAEGCLLQPPFFSGIARAVGR